MEERRRVSSERDLFEVATRELLSLHIYCISSNQAKAEAEAK